MVSWRYIEPGDHDEAVEHVLTEAEIIDTYFPWWSARMEKVGKGHDISHRNCIDDWVVVHWAERVPQP